MSERRCVLAGLNTGMTTLQFEKSMKEMAALAEASGLEVCAVFTQSLPRANTGYYIGSGKIEEIRLYLEETGTDLVLFDSQLTPMQLRNLTNAFHCEVLDRTALILTIFAERAGTREALLQVDYARLQYLLPRLAGMHDDLSRQGGTSGAMSNRGAGEKKIELDRRRIEHRMAQLRKELEEVRCERDTQRRARMRSGLPRVSLVGYTNAGKSTILNGMIDAFSGDDERKVLEKDMLFATLDTTVRRIEPGGNRKPFLLSDTVGFIDRLPTTLVKAFRSTLEETKYADLLLIVSDLSDPDYRENLKVTIRTLEEIGAGEIPRIFIFNKADCAPGTRSDQLSVPGLSADDGRITISAKKKSDIIRLAEAIQEKLNEERRECELLIPYANGSVLAALKKGSDMQILDYTENGTLVRAVLSAEDYSRYRAYVTERP